MDYKILTKLFALRLRHILPDIIHPDQRGFIHGRRLDHGILDIYALLDLVDHGEMDGLLCTIDIAKAFDSLDWDFVKYELRLYGFPESFIKWFDILCSNKEVRIVNNGQWSDSIKVHKGSAQGCPLSPLLFILSIEILAARIRGNTEILGIESDGLTKKLNLVADDILLVFQNTHSGCEQLAVGLHNFSQESGLKINLDKCTISRIGKFNDVPLDPEVLPFFQRKLNSLSYIGIDFNFNISQLWDINVTPKFKKIIKEIRAIKSFGQVSLLGRVQVLKSLFFSQLAYFTTILPSPPPKIVSKFQSDLNDVIWWGRSPKLKFSCAVAHPTQGGIRMIDLSAHLQTQKLLTVQAALDVQNV